MLGELHPGPGEPVHGPQLGVFVPVASRLFPQPSLCLKPTPEQTVEGAGVQFGVHVSAHSPVVFVPTALGLLFPHPSVCVNVLSLHTVEGAGVQLGVQDGGSSGGSSLGGGSSGGSSLGGGSSGGSSLGGGSFLGGGGRTPPLPQPFVPVAVRVCLSMQLS